MKKSLLFFIIGSYGAGNAGDDAMLYALLKEMQTFWPKVEFIITKREKPFRIPKDSHVTTVSTFSLVSLLCGIYKSSVVMLGGGSQIHDFMGRRQWLRILPYKLFLIAFAKFLKKPVFFAFVGIGPLSTFWGKILGSLLLKLADFVIVRDIFSYNILKSLNLSEKAFFSFDVVALLFGQEGLHSYSKYKPIDEPLSKKANKILGISVFPCHEIYDNNPKADEPFLSGLKESIAQWLSYHQEGLVHLIAFNSDNRVIQFYRKLCFCERIKIVPYNHDFAATISEVRNCDYFVGMPFHSILFGYLSHLPMVVIEYHLKCRALAKTIGLPDSAILTIAQVANGELADHLKNIYINPKQYLAPLPQPEACNLAKMGIFKINEIVEGTL